MSEPRKLHQYEVDYIHAQQRELNAYIVPELGGAFRHKTIHTGYSENEVWCHYQQIGANVLSIRRMRRRSGIWNHTSHRVKLQVLQSLSFNCRAGLSPVKSLEQVASSFIGPEKLTLNDVERSLMQGRSFSDSLDLTGWYNESTMAILRTGEVTGQLPQAIHSSVAHFGKSSDLVKVLIGTTILTAFDLFMATGAIIGTRFGLIPSVKSQGIQTEDEQIKIDFENSLAHATMVNDLLLAGIVLIFGSIVLLVFMLLSKNQVTRGKAISFINRVPIVGPLLECVGVSNTLTVMAELIRNGVRIRQSIDIARRASSHEGVKGYLRAAAHGLDKGIPVRKTFAVDPLSVAEKIVIQSSNDGEQFSESLKNIAEAREEMGRMLAKKFSIAALIASLLYSGISVGFSLWVVYIQNSTLLGGSQ